MILITQGAGGLVAVIWFVSILAGGWLATALFGDDVSNGRSNLTGEWLAAVLTLGLGLLLRNDRELRLDPDSGQQVEVQVDHALFFIPVLAWPVIFFIIGIAVYYNAPAPSPALIEVTPEAAAKVKQTAAAQSLGKGWYVRIEASWPKGDAAPRHTVKIVTTMDSARDCEFRANGVKVVVLKRQVDMLRGARLDFGKQDAGEGFRITNPNFEGGQSEKWRRDLEYERFFESP